MRNTSKTQQFALIEKKQFEKKENKKEKLIESLHLTVEMTRRSNWPFRSCVGNWGEFQI